MILTPTEIKTSLNQIGSFLDWEPSSVSPMKEGSLFELGTDMEHNTAIFLLEIRNPFVSNTRRKKRRYITYLQVDYIYAHLIWCANHVGSKIKNGEVIHHINGDTLDDRPINLRKMLHGEHTSLHASNRSKATRKILSDNAKRQWQTSPPVKLKWCPVEAHNLKIEGLSWRAIAREFGVGHNTVYSYFQRRGLTNGVYA